MANEFRNWFRVKASGSIGPMCFKSGAVACARPSSAMSPAGYSLAVLSSNRLRFADRLQWWGSFRLRSTGKTSQPLAGGQLLPSSKPAKMRAFYSGTDTNGSPRLGGTEAGSKNAPPARFFERRKEGLKVSRSRAGILMLQVTRDILLNTGQSVPPHFSRKRSRIKQIGRYLSVYLVNLCTRHIPDKLTPRGHDDWPDKRRSVYGSWPTWREVGFS